MNKIWHDVKELLEKDVSTIVMKNDIPPQDLEKLDKVTDICLDICRMEKYEAEMFNGFNSEKRFAMTYDSEAMRNRNNVAYPHHMNNPSYDGYGNSYGGQSYPQMGMSNANPMGHNQYTNNMSKHSIEDRIIHEMELMMDNTGSDYERNKLQEYITKMRSGM